MSRRTLTIYLAIIVSVCTVRPALTGTTATMPILVEIWHVGDDGLSERLADSVEAAFAHSPDFETSTGRRPGTLVMTIPSNVEWTRVGSRLKARYIVEFSTIDGKSLGRHTGFCWEDDLAQCSEQIMKNALAAARKLH